MSKSLYIFDLDGTLALIDHRLHFIQQTPKDWRGFFAACTDDVPNAPVVIIALTLMRHADVWIWSGRSDEVRPQTAVWLVDRGLPTGNDLKMRRAGDYRADEVVKEKMLEGMAPEDRQRLVATFDDRDRMVKMWRAHNITCLQVAPGEF